MAAVQQNALPLENIETVLHEEGLDTPTLQFLVPNADRFSCLLMQPRAEVVDAPTGVSNRDAALARAKHRAFLALGVQHDPDLLVTPEYSCPWDILEESINANRAPSAGKMWVVGCEAISRADLELRRGRAPANVKWIYEDLDALDWSAGAAFLDPACIVFRSRVSETNADIIVVLIQFKTAPMGGVTYEANLLAKGRTFYLLKNPGDDSIKSLCLICSDVLSFPNQEWNNIRALFNSLASLLVLHIQLNAEPRHAQYRAYRALLLSRQENRELLCLNWSRNAVVYSAGNPPQPWANDSASAVYSRRWHTRHLEDQILEAAEARGIYFCYSHDLRSTVAFLNFQESCFRILLTKPNQNLANPENRIPQPPEVSHVWLWDAQQNDWRPAAVPIDSEARAAIAASGINVPTLAAVIGTPLRFERFAAISIGNLPLRESVQETEWPDFTCVDAHRLDAAESIMRTSFAQDRCPQSTTSRTNAYMRLSHFLVATGNPASFPPWMVGFRVHSFAYDHRVPYSNLRDPNGQPGTAIFLPTAELEAAETLRTRLDKHIRSSAKVPGLECDPLHVVTWIPEQKNGAIAPRVYPVVRVPRQADDPNSGDNQINSQVS